MYLKYLLIFFTFFIINDILSQIQFGIEYLENEQKYLVFMHADVNWSTPNNITSTAQITIKTATESFEVTELESQIEGVQWQAISRFDQPEEAAEFDYIAFGLSTIATRKFTFEAGQSTPLFTFKNQLECGNPIYLVNNDSDPFMPPNSMKSNIGNQITTMGAKGDAFTGIWGDGVADCNATTNVKDRVLKNVEHSIFPNPVKDQMNLNFTWNETAKTGNLVIYNVTGTKVLERKLDILNGENAILLDTKEIPEGLYYSELELIDTRIQFSSFVKSN